MPTEDVTITASWTINKYTVTFKDYNDTELKSESVEYGKAATAPADPEREGYTFAGWDVDFDNVTGDLTVTATYEIKTYTVTFVDEDESVLETQTVEYGTTPEYKGETPTKGATAEFTYTFSGWTPEVSEVTGAVTYTATYSSETNKYTVTFKDYNDTELKSESVEYGKAATAPADPEREGYTFAGWDVDFDNVTGDLTVTATYEIKTYTVTFVDEDESVLETQTVEYGTTPEYKGETPTKGATAEFTYTFSGWTPEVSEVTGAVTYTATYSSETNEYTVTFKDYNDTELKSESVEYGKAATAPADPEREGYTFAGWDVDFDNVTGDLTVTATYEIKTYTVTFVDEDESVLETQTVEYGTTPEYKGETPTKGATAEFTYTFSGWTPEVSEVTGAVTYTATYSSETNKYTVTFKDYNDTELKSESVEYGKAATAPADPEREGYTFAGWDVDFDNVTVDLTVTATYEIKTYTVTFVDEDESVLETQTVEYGTTPEYKGETPTKGATAEFTYTFSGWTPEVSEVTGDVTYTATYSSETNEYTVTFKDYNDTELKSETVEYGKSAPAPSDPERTGYTFTGWDVDFDNVTGDLTVTATYEIKTYTVTFVDEDESVLETQTVEYGTTPEYKGETPTKGATAEFTYTFSGWTPEVSEVTGDVTYTATYSSETNKYTVTFKDYNDTELKSESVEYGKAATAPADPEREGYTFAGWDVDFDNVTVDLTVTATYEIKTYTVTFVDEDESVLETQTVEYGTTPEYKGETPTKGATAEFTYTFSGWTPEVSEVTGAVTYTATYSSETNKYTVTFKDYNDTELKSESVEYGKAATAPADPEREGYTFTGWDVDFDNVTGDLTVTATYEIKTYTVTFVDEDESVLETQTVEYGTTPEYKGETPTKGATAEFTYTFSGWTPEVSEVTGAVTYTATYSSETNEYTVTFKDYNDTELKSETVEYGKAATAPADPEREGYTFAGWAVDFDNVTGDLTVTATYKDDEAPVLKYDGETEIIVGYGVEFTIPKVTDTDNLDGTVDVNAVITDVDSNIIETIDTTVAGAYTITYSAIDAAGNKAEELEISVLVAPVAKNKEKAKFYFDENNGLAMALSEAESGDVVILLADHTLNENAIVKEGVTLLLPFDHNHSISTIEVGSANTGTVDRKNGPYVELLIPEDINLNVNGILTVNAQRSAGTPKAGQIVGKNYSQIKMLDNSKINVNSGGIVNSIGFIYGSGTMEVKRGGTVFDTLLITDFRGGSITSSIFSKVFPFDQFSFHNTEVDLTIQSGARYSVKSMNYINAWYPVDVNIISNSDYSLIKLNSGKIIKTYDTETGQVTLDIVGDAEFNDLELMLSDVPIFGTLDITTKDKEMPFPGNFQLNVKSGSTVKLNAGVKLLPGAGLNIEEGAEAVISNTGRLMVYDADEYERNLGYPIAYKPYYREDPNYQHDTTTPAKLIINGKLVVNGGIAGKIDQESNGRIIVNSTASTNLDIKHVNQAAASLSTTNYKLKDASETEITEVATYNIKNGLVDMSLSLTFVKDNQRETIEQEYGVNYKTPDWDYTDFIGWFSEEIGGSKVDLDGTVDVILYDEVYGQWDKGEKVAISFDTNGGEAMDDCEVSKFSSDIDLSENIPTKENAIFLGWYFDIEFVKPYSQEYVFSEATTLYARWAEGGINIKVDVSPNTTEGATDITITATVEDGEGTLLEGISVLFSGEGK
ncbi:InlB B-repeat-containing protein [Acholeplasma laidlawii]|uniref:InlB B-repeat-containing protein n=1 Tax=Acholeplasma laidlawii TaxID=2148 RepID=UPI003F92EEE2